MGELAGPIEIVLFLAASFAAAAIAGLAGFAFGLVAAGVWLQLLTPVQTTTLIVVCGLLIQGVSAWSLRHAFDIRRLWPFLVGGALGVPVGVELLRWVSPDRFRLAVGVGLVAFSAYSLARPRLGRVTAGGRAADGGIGVLSGLIGGATGLSGILPTVWCSLRSWQKDEQRAVFQPVAVGLHAMTALWLGGTGAVNAATLWLLVLALPAVLAGTWLGLRLYGRLDDASFRKVVLALLLVSGIALMR